MVGRLNGISGKFRLQGDLEAAYLIHNLQHRRFHIRFDKRPGLILSQIEANDQGKWRSVLYEAHLSEVFVPYMDPGQCVLPSNPAIVSNKLDRHQLVLQDVYGFG